MKITPIIIPAAYKSYEITVPREVAEVPSLKKDQLELSGEAKSFASMLQLAKVQMGERSTQEINRISEVAKQVQSGDYKIDSQAVAARILGVDNQE